MNWGLELWLLSGYLAFIFACVFADLAVHGDHGSEGRGGVQHDGSGIPHFGGDYQPQDFGVAVGKKFSIVESDEHVTGWLEWLIGVPSITLFGIEFNALLLYVVLRLAVTFLMGMVLRARKFLPSARDAIPSLRHRARIASLASLGTLMLMLSAMGAGFAFFYFAGSLSGQESADAFEKALKLNKEYGYPSGFPQAHIGDRGEYLNNDRVEYSIDDITQKEIEAGLRQRDRDGEKLEVPPAVSTPPEPLTARSLDSGSPEDDIPERVEDVVKLPESTIELDDAVPPPIVYAPTRTGNNRGYAVPLARPSSPVVSSSNWFSAERVVTTILTRITAAALILFLMQILVPMYRYSARLSGFYHARADALVLLDQHPNFEFEKMVEMLSPDGLDFGRLPKSPADLVSESGTKTLELAFRAANDKLGSR